MDPVFYAKSKSMDGYQETNQAHLSKVAELAERFGTQINAAPSARLCGQLHDFGKYSDRFQGVLLGAHTHIDHAICGAAMLRRSVGEKYFLYRHILEAISGHHDGLVDYHALQSPLNESTTSDTPILAPGGKAAALAGQHEYALACQYFARDFPAFKVPRLPNTCTGDTLDDMLHTRMVFSCLVDADYTASADMEDPGESAPLNADALLERLYAYCDNTRRRSTAAPEVNRLRDSVFERCGEMGLQAGGPFTLTAPTGVGKTLALLHFALQHCMAWHKQRIIIVLPFLAIAEQNAEVYASIVPDVLIDHSQSDLDEAGRLHAARWDSRFIITTSVNFFETLFAQKPTDCRKLHNIANSVVIFDEAQSLPSDLAAATVKAVSTLCKEYGCTTVFSTATQPDFSSLPNTHFWRPAEIVDDSATLYRTLRRTTVNWRLDKPTPLLEVADEMAQLSSVCVIVNLRRHARTLYAALKAACPEEEVFFLTTDLCPSHRSDVIATVRERLLAGLPCRVVATQCIEAGVDLDFEVLYRALAPLEAIIQAAGRCNRNGRLYLGIVHVFEPADSKNPYPDNWYQKAALLVKAMWADGGGLDIHDPAAINAYYSLLFSGAEERRALSSALEGRHYEGVAKEYKLIHHQGVRVIVPYAGHLALYQDIHQAVLSEGITAALMQRAAPITVSSFDAKRIQSCCEQLYYPARRKGERAPSNYFILPLHLARYYSEDMGLQWTDIQPESFFVE